MKIDLEKSNAAHKRLMELHRDRGMKTKSKTNEKKHFIHKEYHADVLTTQISSRKVLSKADLKQKFNKAKRTVSSWYK